MTKEEAAIIIHKLKQDVLTGAVRKYEPFEGEVLLSAEFYDAINMAIEALKQEPCEDAVSRKAVYEILNDAYFLKLDDGAALQESVRQLPPVKPQEPCEDAISRRAAVNACLNKWDKDYKEIVADIRALPPVKPQEPTKTGHWIYTKAVTTGEILWSECSECKSGERGCAKRMKYCPSCGCRMTEVSA